jgi:TatD DNase family protein
MTKLIDTHAHIYLDEFHSDIEDVIKLSSDAGVEKVFMPNIDVSTIDNMLDLELRFPGICIPMMGLHPCYVKQNYAEELHIVEGWFEKRKFCAVGEIGIDLYWDKTYVDEQVKAFEFQLDIAKNLDIPAVIHCRDSIDMTIDLVRKNQDGRLKGIFHCFTGTRHQATQIIDLGFLLGIGGVVTFKNGGLDKVIPYVNLDHIVLETDSPYLAPAPYRGKRNMPSYLQYIVTKIAELKDCETAEVVASTSKNANDIFRDG